jgi:hypothetical protein
MRRSTLGGPTRRAARLGVLASTGLALTLSTGLVWQASYSAYSATTANGTDNWATGTVALTDDDSGTAMFSATNLRPGSTGTKCITVTSNGTLPAAVKLYGSGAATTNALSTYIDLSVTMGTGGSFGSCTGYTSGGSVYTGTLAGFTGSSYATGYGTWAPTGSPGESRTYQFTYTVQAAAPTSTQGGTASISFTWESQNT